MNFKDELLALIKKVENTISKHNMIDHGDTVVVGVSGGPDSVCLLDVLYELKGALRLNLIVAHYDHGLRPHEDKKETLFVKQLAKRYGVVFVCEESQELRPGIPSPEETARNLRYNFLENTRKKFSAERIALGHNMDDQAETVIMRLIRGSGVSGLAGIPPIRGEAIIRPLIECTREEILSYLTQKGLQWMVDSSNLQPDYLRNKVRLEVMPLLKKYQPRISQVISQTAEILRKEDLWLEQQAEKWMSELVTEKGDGYVTIRLSQFIGVPEALRARIVRGLIRSVKGNLRRITSHHIKAVCHLADSSKAQGKVQLPDGISVIKTYHVLEISSARQIQKEFCYYIEGPGVVTLPFKGLRISVEEMDVSKPLPRLDESRWTAFFDGHKVNFPLTVRNFRPGDRFVPLGMKGHKKLKDFFIDLKIPWSVRKTLPILLAGDEIIWVCGLRINDRFKVDSNTEKILRISFEGRPMEGNG